MPVKMHTSLWEFSKLFSSFWWKFMRHKEFLKYSNTNVLRTKYACWVTKMNFPHPYPRKKTFSSKYNCDVTTHSAPQKAYFEFQKKEKRNRKLATGVQTRGKHGHLFLMHKKNELLRMTIVGGILFRNVCAQYFCQLPVVH